jgi:hypothetical protein
VSRGAAPPVSLLGLAHVASCSFLASRLAPSGQFFAALGGGIALAQAGARHGLRAGYGASVAAVVQTVAFIGPARVNGPLTQALNAPLAGHLQARGAALGVRLAAVLAVRLVHYAVLNVVFVALVVGGLDAYVATYDKVAAFTRVLPTGTAAAVWLTVLSQLAMAVFFSAVQVVVYDRALRRWPTSEGDGTAGGGALARVPLPLAALALTTVAWVALLAAPRWGVLAAVGAGLVLATAVTPARRAGRQVWGVGFGLAAALAIAALGPAILGAVPWEDAGRRAGRAALLVLTATWVRAVSDPARLREAARQALAGVRAVQAAQITERLESDARLLPAARSFLASFEGVPTRPGPLADALTGWCAAEAARYEPPR